MKLRSMRVEHTPRLMIIPMIDIIFFLLVFFMLSTLYMTEQRSLPVQLPQASAGQIDTVRKTAVTVTAEGLVLVNEETVPMELVRRRIQAELARHPDMVFELRADRRVDYGRVIYVLDELKGAGVTRIAVATEAKER